MTCQAADQLAGLLKAHMTHCTSSCCLPVLPLVCVCLLSAGCSAAGVKILQFWNSVESNLEGAKRLLNSVVLDLTGLTCCSKYVNI